MCEYEQRNLAIIEEIMIELGVSDIEELPAKVREIKEAAEQNMHPTAFGEAEIGLWRGLTDAPAKYRREHGGE